MFFPWWKSKIDNRTYSRMEFLMMAKRHRKIIIALTIVTTTMTIVSASWEFIMRMYIQYKFQINTDNYNSASSIAIIGGADGPTAIFINGKQYSSIITLVFAFLSAVGIIYLILSSKRNRRQK
jgi:Na+-transporting methylmalonyl-CoA/oxaloacetate decarboxylase beta subunit